MTKDSLKSILSSRAKKCIKLSNGLLSTGDYYIAGSSIATNKINDIDVYPVKDKPFIIPALNVVVKTKNATTVNNDPNPPIQFCRYLKPSLVELLESFDFAHIQAGVHVSDGNIVSVEFTEAFLYSSASRTSTFTGSEYPLSSAIRLLKYHKRKEISDMSSMISMLKIITCVVERGFDGYEDFKDQLDAVDLGMVPDQMDEMMNGTLDYLLRLFNKLNNG